MSDILEPSYSLLRYCTTRAVFLLHRIMQVHLRGLWGPLSMLQLIANMFNMVVSGGASTHHKSETRLHVGIGGLPGTCSACIAIAIGRGSLFVFQPAVNKWTSWLRTMC